MLDIDFQSDEVLILNDETACFDNKMGELFLTNKRIIWAKKSAFGNKIKEMKELPLHTVKVHNGEVQVKVAGQFLEPEIQIQHTNGISSINFPNKLGKKAVIQWVNEIHKAITGQTKKSNLDELGNLAIPGMDVLGKGIKDSVGAFAEGLGVKSMISKSKSITMKCPACGASLSGEKGEQVICEFCGTKQVL